MSTYSLRARWVVPVSSPPIEGGCVVLSGDRIVDLGGVNVACGPIEDLGDAALAPGWVNVHCHLEFSDLAKPLGEPNTSLPVWIEQVIGHRKRSGRNATAAIAAGLAESLAAGVTTIGEIATAQPSVYAVAGPRPRLVLLHEAIGFSAARTESVFADVTRRAEACPADGIELLANGVSPHAPYTVHPAFVGRLAEWAAAHAAPMAMHLAESPEELQLLAEGEGPFQQLLDSRSMWDPEAIPAGSRPLDYLRRMAAAETALAVHGNYFGREEIELLGAESDRLSAVYCPRTHQFFGHEPYPLAALQSAKARVVLGTDSRASNPDLDLRQELRAALSAHPILAPATAVRMGTLDAAVALGVSDRIGSLEAGKYADLVAYACSDKSDPYEQLIAATAPTAVWLSGRQVVG